jgi:hypothetical protein
VRFSASGFAKRKDLFGMLMPKKPLDVQERETRIREAQQRPEEIANAIKIIFDVSPSATDLNQEIDSRALEIIKEEAVRESVASYLRDPGLHKENMEWRDGFLVDFANRASQEGEKDKTYTIIIDNAEALPGRVRVLLNPVLWEKQADVPDQRKKVRIPPNVQFIFTMDHDSVVRDDSFLNRVLVQFTSSFNLSKSGFLVRKCGIAPEIETKLFTLLDVLKKAQANGTFRNPAEWSFSDIYHLANRVSGRLRDDASLNPTHVLAHEVGMY